MWMGLIGITIIGYARCQTFSGVLHPSILRVKPCHPQGRDVHLQLQLQLQPEYIGLIHVSNAFFL